MSFDSGVFREKSNCASAMIRRQKMRAFERGTTRAHTVTDGFKPEFFNITFYREVSIKIYDNINFVREFTDFG